MSTFKSSFSKPLLVGAVLAWGLAPASGAETSEMVVGNAGELYEARTGSFGEFFPEDESQAAGTPVLALEVRQAGGALSRFLVPGTENSRAEARPLLTFESGSDRTILLWQSEDETGIRVEFAVFDGADWSETYSVSGDHGAVLMPGRPIAAVTRETYRFEIDAEAFYSDRSLIHLVWRFDDGIYYSPLIFIDGAYTGWNPIFSLGDLFLLSKDGGAGVELTSALLQALTLQVADDGRSVLLAFADGPSKRLVAFEIGILPLAVALLGDDVRERIRASIDEFDPQDPQPFADVIRAEIVVAGRRLRLNPAVLDYVSQGIERWIVEKGSSYAEDPPGLSEGARNRTIDMTSKLFASAGVELVDGSEIFEIDLSDGAEPGAVQILDVRVVADRAAPAVGEGLTAIYVSGDGKNLLVGWKPDGQGTIRYVESRERNGKSWSQQRALALGDDLDLGEANLLLQEKVR